MASSSRAHTKCALLDYPSSLSLTRSLSLSCSLSLSSPARTDLPGSGDNFALKQICNGDDRLWRALGKAPAKYHDNFGRGGGKAWFPPKAVLSPPSFQRLARLFRQSVTTYFEFPPPWLGTEPNRFNVPTHLYRAATKAPLLSHAEAKRFASEHGIDLEGEARRYTHIAYARLRRPSAAWR